MKIKKQSLSSEPIKAHALAHTCIRAHISSGYPSKTLFWLAKHLYDHLSDSIWYRFPDVSLCRSFNWSSSFLPLNILAFPGNCLLDTLPIRFQLPCHLIKQLALNAQAHVVISPQVTSPQSIHLLELFFLFFSCLNFPCLELEFCESRDLICFRSMGLPRTWKRSPPLKANNKWVLNSSMNENYWRSSPVARGLRTWHSVCEDSGPFCQWVKDPALLEVADIGHRCSSDPVLLWLWCRPAAAVPIRPLA